MITQAHRFHGRGSLRTVYRHGKTIRTPELAVRYILNGRRRSYRLAVIVSTSVSKSAVKRNRIRRRLFEIVRHHDKRMNAPYDLLLTVFKPEVATMPADELSQTVVALLIRAEVFSAMAEPASKTT